jgi:hypothetical protein
MSERRRRKQAPEPPPVRVRPSGFITGWYRRADGEGPVHFCQGIPGSTVFGVALCEGAVGTTRPLAGIGLPLRLAPAEVPRPGAGRCGACWRALIGGQDDA